MNCTKLFFTENYYSCWAFFELNDVSVELILSRLQIEAFWAPKLCFMTSLSLRLLSSLYSVKLEQEENWHHGTCSRCQWNTTYPTSTWDCSRLAWKNLNVFDWAICVYTSVSVQKMVLSSRLDLNISHFHAVVDPTSKLNIPCSWERVPSPLNPSTAAHQLSQPLCSFWLHRDKKTTAVFSRGWLECCTSALNSLFENRPQIPLESCWITESGNTLDWWYKCSQRQFFSAQLI